MRAPVLTSFVLSLSASVLVSAPAFAQPAPSQSALQQSLRLRADEARARGDHAAALDLFEAAGRLGMDPTLRWAIAFEALQLGRNELAHESATACVHESEAALRAPGATVNRGVALAATQCAEILSRLASATPATPAASPPTTPAPAPAPPAQPAAPPATLIDPPLAFRPRPVAARSGVPIGAVVLLAGGGTALVLGGVFAGLRASALSPCLVDGDTATCPTPEALYDARSAPTWAAAGNVAFAVGGAAVVGGALWLLLGRGDRESSSNSPRVTASAGGLGIRW